MKPNFVVIKNITINFIISYRAKSILQAYKKEEENSNRNLRKEESTHDSASGEETKNLGAIVMQKTTFLELQSFIKSVDAFKTIRIFIR